MSTFGGKTSDSPILGASFWKKGTRIDGARVVRKFDTSNGPCYELQLKEAVVIGKDKYHHVSIGNMKGFQMALSSAGLDSLERGDTLTIEAIGTTETDKGNPRVDFSVLVNRPDRKNGF